MSLSQIFHFQVLIKMGVAAPPKKLIEQYMIEIAKSFNIPFEPDPTALVVSGEGPNMH